MHLTFPAADLLTHPRPVSAPERQRGAYALITDDDGRVLTVFENGRHYLPGGRIEVGELPTNALLREIEEECGWAAQALEPLLTFEQPIMAGSVTLRASYFRARLVRPLGLVGEHEMVWLPRGEALAKLHRTGDRLAVEAAL